jgi:hypothetical protein
MRVEWVLREEGGTTVKEIARAKNGLNAKRLAALGLSCDPDAFTSVARVSGERNLRRLVHAPGRACFSPHMTLCDEPAPDAAGRGE